MILVVAMTPLMLVVTTPLLAEILLLLIIEAEVVTPFTFNVRVFIADDNTLLLIRDPVVVAVFPFTIEVRVKEFVEVEIDRVLLVDEATRFDRSVDVATPLIEVVKTVPLVVKLLLLTTDDVATTPFTFNVRVLPDTEAEKLLMIFVTDEYIPFTIVCKRLFDDEATFVLMIVEVEERPLIVVVKTLLLELCVNEFINCFTPEVTPLIIFSK